MEEINSHFEILDSQQEQPGRLQKLGLSGGTIFKHALLLVLTFISVAYTNLVFGFGINLAGALLFAVYLLLFLGIHEFGHYFASVYHRVRTTLPYFIPLPFISPIGTMGAVIRIKERVEDTIKIFDIGIAGPLAGFVVSLTLLIIGFATLPSPDFVFSFSGHEALKEFIYQFHTFPKHPLTENNGQVLMLGNTLLYSLLASFFKNVPPMWEMYHYPLLFAGWLGLFFTALNLTPIGQLDGGHIVYALLGHENHKRVARGFFGILTVLSGLGVIPMLVAEFTQYGTKYAPLAWAAWAIILFFMLRKAYKNEHNWIAPVWGSSLIITALIIYFLIGMNENNGYTVWLVWALFVMFLVKIEHPPVIIERPLTRSRIILGWVSMLILILCISPNPMYFFNS